MNKYEILYILKSDLDEAGITAQTEKYSKLVTDNGGQVEGINKWGVKRFAYPVNFKNEGFYVLMTFFSQPSLPLEMERQMGISDEVIRFMITSGK